MAQQKPSIDDIVFRRAKLTDYQSVINMDAGYEMATDTLPIEFPGYFDYPLRFVYVATYNGDVVGWWKGRALHGLLHTKGVHNRTQMAWKFRENTI